MGTIFTVPVTFAGTMCVEASSEDEARALILSRLPTMDVVTVESGTAFAPATKPRERTPDVWFVPEMAPVMPSDEQLRTDLLAVSVLPDPQ
ncbi:MAG: hypothetical protein K2X45_12515 [Phreatobacter sp.]|nr:hypothetical protein [Phreatobacter sp.]